MHCRWLNAKQIVRKTKIIKYDKNHPRVGVTNYICPTLRRESKREQTKTKDEHCQKREAWMQMGFDGVKQWEFSLISCRCG